MIERLNPFAVSEFLIAFSSLLLGLMVYFRDRTRADYFFWLLFNLSIAVYGLFGGLAALTLNKSLALSLLRIELAAGVLWIPVFFLHFIRNYCGLKGSGELRLIYTVSFAIALLTFTPLFYKDVRLAFGSFYYGVPGAPPFVLIYIGWWLCLFARGLSLLHKHIRNSDKVRANKTKYMLVGVLVGAVGGAFSFLPIFHIDIYPWGNFFVPVYTFLMSYAIIKHQLLDIKVVLRKAIVYSTLVFLIAAIYFLGVYGFYKIILAQVAPRQSLEVGIVTILVVALLFKPLEIVLHRILDRWLYFGTVEELSEKKAKLEIELERRERLKSVGILAAGMAHEIKNPITAIKTFIEHLPSRYGDVAFRERFTKVVGHELGRMESIVKDLLMFSKPADPKKAQFDLAEIIKSQLDLLGSYFIQKGVRTTLSAEPVTVSADAGQIKQVLLNIILNACEATQGKEGRVELEIAGSGRFARIIIRDNGCGIPQERLSHIFDPFYSSKADGTGLGLAVCHSLIEKNGGHISAESVLGSGTTFIIDLPVE